MELRDLDLVKSCQLGGAVPDSRIADRRRAIDPIASPRDAPFRPGGDAAFRHGGPGPKSRKVGRHRDKSQAVATQVQIEGQPGRLGRNRAAQIHRLDGPGAAQPRLHRRGRCRVGIAAQDKVRQFKAKVRHRDRLGGRDHAIHKGQFIVVPAQPPDLNASGSSLMRIGSRCDCGLGISDGGFVAAALGAESAIRNLQSGITAADEPKAQSGQAAFSVPRDRQTLSGDLDLIDARCPGNQVDPGPLHADGLEAEQLFGVLQVNIRDGPGRLDGFIRRIGERRVHVTRKCPAGVERLQAEPFEIRLQGVRADSHARDLERSVALGRRQNHGPVGLEVLDDARRPQTSGQRQSFRFGGSAADRHIVEVQRQIGLRRHRLIVEHQSHVPHLHAVEGPRKAVARRWSLVTRAPSDERRAKGELEAADRKRAGRSPPGVERAPTDLYPSRPNGARVRHVGIDRRVLQNEMLRAVDRYGRVLRFELNPEYGRRRGRRDLVRGKCLVDQRACIVGVHHLDPLHANRSATGQRQIARIGNEPQIGQVILHRVGMQTLEGDVDFRQEVTPFGRAGPVDLKLVQHGRRRQEDLEPCLAFVGSEVGKAHVQIQLRLKDRLGGLVSKLQLHVLKSQRIHLERRRQIDPVRRHGGRGRRRIGRLCRLAALPQDGQQGPQLGKRPILGPGQIDVHSVDLDAADDEPPCKQRHQRDRRPAILNIREWRVGVGRHENQMPQFCVSGEQREIQPFVARVQAVLLHRLVDDPRQRQPQRNPQDHNHGRQDYTGPEQTPEPTVMVARLLFDPLLGRSADGLIRFRSACGGGGRTRGLPLVRMVT